MNIAIRNAFECDQNCLHLLACVAWMNTFGNQGFRSNILIIQMPQTESLGIKLILLKSQSMRFCFQTYTF